MDKGQRAEASSCWACTGQSFKGAHQPDREERVPHIFKGKAKQIKETGMVSVILMFLGGVITVGALFLMAQVLLFLQDVDEER
jgi:hypothetical protein